MGGFRRPDPGCHPKMDGRTNERLLSIVGRQYNPSNLNVRFMGLFGLIPRI